MRELTLPHPWPGLMRNDCAEEEERLARIVRQRLAHRERQLLRIRTELKSLPTGLSMQELFDMVVCLQVAAATHLVEPIEALKDLACTFDGAATYGVESVDWGQR